MATIAVHAPELTGVTGLTLYLYSLEGDLLNSGGDSLTETPSSSGRFVADVAEDLSATVHARVHDAAGIVRDGWLPDDTTLVIDSYPATVSGGGGGSGDAEQATSEEILDVVTVNGQKLDRIEAKTALITAAKLRVTSRVDGLTITAKIGDDHLLAAENALLLSIPDETGSLFTFLTNVDHEAVEFGAAQSGKRDEITATIDVAEIYRDAAYTVIPVELTSVSTIAKKPGEYLFDIQVTTEDGYLVTKPELQGTLILEHDAKS
jgi:hypothetical protein